MVKKMSANYCSRKICWKSWRYSKLNYNGGVEEEEKMNNEGGGKNVERKINLEKVQGIRDVKKKLWWWMLKKNFVKGKEWKKRNVRVLQWGCN